MDSGKLVLGLLAGVSIGATMGVLLAPEKGTITRRELSKKGTRYEEDMEDKLCDLMESVAERIEQMKDEAVRSMARSEHRAEKMVAEAMHTAK